MNALFRSAVERNRSRLGDRVSRLGLSPPVDTGSVTRQERLNGLLSDRELALQAGDADALDFVEGRIDKLFGESREATAKAEPPAAPISFDGGVRGQRSLAPPPGMRVVPTANDLFREAMARSYEERHARAAEAEADGRRTSPTPRQENRP